MVTKNGVNTVIEKSFPQFLKKLNSDLKDAAIEEFLTFDNAGIRKSAKCLLCEKIFEYTKQYNLLRHLYTIHNDAICEFIRNLENNFQKKMSFFNNFKCEADKIYEIKSYMSITELENYIIDIMKSGVSFTFFENNGFKNIIKTTAETFNMTIDRKSVSNILISRYNKEVESLKHKFKGNVLNLKLDGVTLLNRYFLGINVQYIDKDKIIVKNLSLEEISGKTNSEKLKDVLMSVLRFYEIELSQIFSVVTDNGANYVKIGKLLNNDYNTIISSYGENGEEDEIYGESLLDIEENPISYIENLEEHFNSINIIRCGCHTLQLAIHDSLKNDLVFIGKIRDVIKIFRTPIFREKIRGKVPVPCLDVITRWNSTFYMLKSFLDIADFIIENNIKDFDQDEILVLKDNASQFVNNYSLLESLTLQYQRKNLLYSEFVYLWIKTENDYFKLRRNSEFLNTIFIKLKERGEIILENDIAFSAIYLDPRFRSFVVSNQTLCMKVKQFIVKVFNKTKKNKNSIVEEASDLSDLAQFFKSRVQCKAFDNIFGDGEAVPEDLNLELTRYEAFMVDVNHESFNPLAFWETCKSDFKHLYNIATILLSVPSSQVSVERLFSMLKFIMNPQRARLSEKNLKMLLFLAFNKE